MSCSGGGGGGGADRFNLLMGLLFVLELDDGVLDTDTGGCPSLPGGGGGWSGGGGGGG